MKQNFLTRLDKYSVSFSQARFQGRAKEVRGLPRSSLWRRSHSGGRHCRGEQELASGTDVASCSRLQQLYLSRRAEQDDDRDEQVGRTGFERQAGECAEVARIGVRL